MDAILKIFKWSISPDTLFFESLAKKSLTLMDNLFRRVDKYVILEDDNCPSSNGQNQSRLIRPGDTENDDALTIKSMDIPWSSARTCTT
ncbi:hypothetical protein CK203_008518 [Vitis vinifera]|uniref:Uncharacterized protein n=1 Tax=Vitis vinifera TaxID=29760 RepID=A0A438KDY6_VITVI|nr:hypothetical protein CK203_008518 [Vitis vinifera]